MSAGDSSNEDDLTACLSSIITTSDDLVTNIRNGCSNSQLITIWDSLQVLVNSILV